ncbi:hypothetical protein [Microbulbifer sp. SAOS-129_SWC]|uniref:hypothetical protein n=1 Tax=Microbulbifer sp. SAOS-129_SWC TaxID=3145235 RepID=UPI003217EDBC
MSRNKRAWQPKGRHINSLMRGLRLIAMESNGLEDDGTAKLGIDASLPTMRTLASLGNADHLIRRLQHNWLVMVVVIIRDWRGDIDTAHHFFIGKGQRINDLAEDVQPALEKVRGEVNEKFIIDWGWIAEILPNSNQDKKQDQEAYMNRAEEYLQVFIQNRHLKPVGQEEKAA